VYLTPKLQINHLNYSAKPKNTREIEINPKKDLFDNQKHRVLCSLASSRGKPHRAMLQIQ
jgi:hypothetical protein